MVWKMAALSTSGTHGLVMSHAESHSRLAPSTWTVLTVREEDLMACSVLGQLAWLATILGKEMPAPGCMSAASAATPGSEGVEEFSLPSFDAQTMLPETPPTDGCILPLPVPGRVSDPH
jgi:hypothetical protein